MESELKFIKEAVGDAANIRSDFFALSTSGDSENIVNALKVAQRKGVHTVGLSGEKVADMDKFCDFILKVPSKSVPRIQEVHTFIIHIICELVEHRIFGAS